jgi:hypothetical protein
VRQEPARSVLQDVRSPGAQGDEGRAFGGVSSLTDEQIETAIAAIREMLDKREKALAGEVIEGKAEPVALPAPVKDTRSVG